MILLVGKGNELSGPEISSEVEKVISDDRKIAETFNEFLKIFTKRKLRKRCRK